MHSGMAPGADDAEAWRQRLNDDPTAIVALADHLLRTCGLAMRLGGAVDPAPLFEMLQGLSQMPAGDAIDHPIRRAQYLLDGGGLALSGLAASRTVTGDQLPAMVLEVVAAIAKGDEPLARQMATPLLGTIVGLPEIPALPAVPEPSMVSTWLDAAQRIRHARYGTV